MGHRLLSTRPINCTLVMPGLTSSAAGLPPCLPAVRPPARVQGSESVPTGRGLEKFGDGCLFITYSLLISGLGGRKAKQEETEAVLAGELPKQDQGRIK